MNNRCIECGGELIVGTLAGMYAACFYPKDEEKKMKGRKSKTVCTGRNRKAAALSRP